MHRLHQGSSASPILLLSLHLCCYFLFQLFCHASSAYYINSCRCVPVKIPSPGHGPYCVHCTASDRTVALKPPNAPRHSLSLLLSQTRPDAGSGACGCVPDGFVSPTPDRCQTNETPSERPQKHRLALAERRRPEQRLSPSLGSPNQILLRAESSPARPTSISRIRIQFLIPTHSRPPSSWRKLF